MHIIIVGGGRIGRRLAELLIKGKHEVVIVEKDLDVAKRLSSQLDALVLGGDGTEEEILLDAGIKKVDVLIAATGDDKSNMLIAEKAKKFGVEKIISRVSNPENYEFFVKLGVTPIDTTSQTIAAIHNAITAPERNILFSISGEAHIVRLLVTKFSPNIGKSLDKINFKENIICIERNRKLVPMEKGEVLLENDIIYALVKPEELERISKAFTGSS